MLASPQYLVNEPMYTVPENTFLGFTECLDFNATNIILQNSNLILNEAIMENDYPHLKIIEQPFDTFRYRYKSEGKKGSHGGIKGESSCRGKKSVPAVKMENCPADLRDKIVVRVSLYTNEPEPKPHVYHLLDMNKKKNCHIGECESTLNEHFVAIFEKIAISSIKKEEIFEILKQRKIKEYASDEKDEASIDREVQEDIKNMNLDSAKLCFEAFFTDDLNTPLCEKIFSSPINNQKSSTSGDLKIDYISHCSGKCSGGDRIVLLCEKVKKEDIKVHFFEKDDDDEVVWEGYGEFSPVDVHHQFAIVFKSPKYKTNVHREVFIELFRPSDRKCSESCSFTYLPDDEPIQHAANKKLPYAGTCNFVKNEFSASSRKRRRINVDEDNQDSGTFLNYLTNSSVIDSPKTTDEEDISSPETIGEEDYNLTQTTDDQNGISTQTNSDDLIDMDEDEFLKILGVDAHSFSDLFRDNMDILSIEPIQNEVHGVSGSYVKPDGITTSMEHLSIADQGAIQKASNDYIDGIKAMFQNRYHLFAHQLVALQDENENSLLHLAILEQNQNWNLIKKMLEIIPEDLINEQNKFKETPLHLSIKGNHIRILLLLLIKGANPNIIDRDGNNGLHLAAKYGRVKMLKLMLLFGRKKTWKHEIKDIDMLNFDGMSALHIAITKNFEDCVTYLLKCKPDVNLPEKRGGQTSLHLAVDHPLVLKAILKQPDIDIYAEDFRGYTAVYLSCLKSGKSFEDVSTELKGDKNKIIKFLGTINQENEVESDWCLKGKGSGAISDGHHSKYLNSETESEDSLTDCSDFEDALEDLNPVSSRHVNSKAAEPICRNSKADEPMTEKKLTLMEMEEELLKFLDINDNWKKVAFLIEVPVDAVDMFDKGLSPGRTVLKHIKKIYPKDSKPLIEILELAGLEEGVQILKKNS